MKVGVARPAGYATWRRSDTIKWRGELLRSRRTYWLPIPLQVFLGRATRCAAATFRRTGGHWRALARPIAIIAEPTIAGLVARLSLAVIIVMVMAIVILSLGGTARQGRRNDNHRDRGAEYQFLHGFLPLARAPGIVGYKHGDAPAPTGSFVARRKLRHEVRPVPLDDAAHLIVDRGDVVHGLNDGQRRSGCLNSPFVQ